MGVLSSCRSSTQIHSREPENPGELRLVKDARVVVLRSKQYEHGWWFGRTTEGSEGLFPKNYVRKLNGEAPPPPPRPTPAVIDDAARARPLSMRSARKAEDHSFVFESLEAFDSLLATGFSIEVITEGPSGATPVTAGSRVTLDCKLLVWEGAYTVAKPVETTSPGEPLSFTVAANQVAEGLDVAVQRLKVGDFAMITCVPNLAYGEDGIPPSVPPRAHIIYEVIIKEVVPSAADAPAAGPKLLLQKAPASSKAAALEEQFFQMANRSSTRMNVKLASNPADVSTEDLIQQASKMGIS